MPHGIEPEVYKVLPEDDVAKFRKALFGDAPHVTLMVAANKGFDRKAFQVNLRAWAAFAKVEPGALLYVHTNPTAQAQGVDLRTLVAALGIADRVRFPDRYSYYLGYPAEFMALLYNAANVLLAASMSEGFGIPIIKAQACGTPVITTDFASMPEPVRWGVAVPPADRFWVSGLESWWAWPDWRSIRDVLGGMGREKAVAALSSRQAINAQIHGEFRWDCVVSVWWRALLDDMSKANPIEVARDVETIDCMCCL